MGSTPPSGKPPERRADQKLIEKQLEKLDELDTHYKRFTVRVMRMLVIIGVATFCALAIGSIQVVRTTNVTARQRQESRERQSQLCVVFERSYQQQVAQLRATYTYLEQLPRAERSNALNRAVIASLTATERQARVQTPPGFCAPSTVGLSEPVPAVPQRPKALNWIPGPRSAPIQSHP